MPNVGEIQKANDVGIGKTSHRVQWLACHACGRFRWVWLRNGSPQSRWCYPCGRTEGKPRGSKPREEHPRWKGGIHTETTGYRSIVIPTDSPFLPMADERGRVYEHRLVVARSLDRCLTSKEQVHHLNGDKLDNRLSNLFLLSRSEHNSEHRTELEILRAEVSRLQDKLRASLSS